jgi:hypothetical protein
MRAKIREVLQDETTWTNANLNAWIADGILDYSNHFRRQLNATLTCTAGTQEYSLSTLTAPADILRVEFPKGEDPPRYLVRRPETGTFKDLPVYDVRGDPPATLILGEEPETGDQIYLTYSADHLLPTTDATSLTVPDTHLEAIKLFVMWQAVRELEFNEAAEPDKTSLLLGMLGLNAVRAERIYRVRLEEYKKTRAPGGYAGPWVADDFDRVY